MSSSLVELEVLEAPQRKNSYVSNGKSEDTLVVLTCVLSQRMLRDSLGSKTSRSSRTGINTGAAVASLVRERRSDLRELDISCF